MRKLREAGYPRYAMLYFFYFFSVAAFTTMLSVYLSGLGLRATEISMVASAAGLFTMAMQPVVGMVYDALGQGRRISVILLAASAALGLAFSRARSVALLFVLCGLTMGLMNSVNPYCERIASHSRYRYGVLRSWGGIGGALAPQLSGILFERFDARVNFVFFAAGAIITAVCLATIRETEDVGKRPARKKAERLLSRPYLLFLVVSFLFNGVTGAGRTYIPLLLQANTAGASAVGTILLGATLMELPIILFSDRFMDRFSGRALMLADIALTIAEYVVYSLQPGSAAVCVAALLTKSVTTMLFIMITLKVVLDIVGEERLLTALSLAGTVSSLGSVAFTWLAGLVQDAAGMRAAFVTLLCGLVVALALAALIRAPQRGSGYFSGAAAQDRGA